MGWFCYPAKADVEGGKLERKMGQGGSHYPVKVKGQERRSANRTARQF